MSEKKRKQKAKKTRRVDRLTPLYREIGEIRDRLRQCETALDDSEGWKSPRHEEIRESVSAAVDALTENL